MFWKPKKRGLVHIEATSKGLLNKGTEYKGFYEVTIVEETEELYKIKFQDALFQRSELIPKWWKKEMIKLLVESKK